MKARTLAPALMLLAIAGCSSESPTTSAAGGAELQPASAPLEAGADVPQFSLEGTDGKTHTPESLTENGPAFVYFVQEVCTGNPRAMPFFNELHEAYGDKVTFVAVINADQAGAESWKREFGAEFVTLLDPNQEAIKAFGLKQSHHTFLINGEGKVEAVYGGYGQDALVPLNEALAKAGGAELAKLDFSDAPKSRAFG